MHPPLLIWPGLTCLFFEQPLLKYHADCLWFLLLRFKIRRQRRTILCEKIFAGNTFGQFHGSIKRLHFIDETVSVEFLVVVDCHVTDVVWIDERCNQKERFIPFPADELKACVR